jgi:hypothetical protein
VPLTTHTPPSFLFADATGEPGLASPMQDVSTPIFLGHGAVPIVSEEFAHEGLLFRARACLAPATDLNPFNFPLVMAELI